MGNLGFLKPPSFAIVTDFGNDHYSSFSVYEKFNIEDLIFDDFG